MPDKPTCPCCGKKSLVRDNSREGLYLCEHGCQRDAVPFGGTVNKETVGARLSRIINLARELGKVEVCQDPILKSDGTTVVGVLHQVMITVHESNAEEFAKRVTKAIPDIDALARDMDAAHKYKMVELGTKVDEMMEKFPDCFIFPKKTVYQACKGDPHWDRFSIEGVEYEMVAIDHTSELCACRPRQVPPTANEITHTLLDVGWDSQQTHKVPKERLIDCKSLIDEIGKYDKDSRQLAKELGEDIAAGLGLPAESIKPIELKPNICNCASLINGHEPSCHLSNKE